MKSSVLFCFSMVFLGLVCGYGSDNDGLISTEPDMDPELANMPPSSFGLLGVADNAVHVSQTPSLEWETSTDPDGDAVVYDILLDRDTDPSTTIGQDLTGTTFTVETPLFLETEYHWKVMAMDDKGNEVQSDGIFSFTTRNLNYPNVVVQQNPFTGRHQHTSLVFDNKLWILGGPLKGMGTMDRSTVQ